MNKKSIALVFLSVMILIWPAGCSRSAHERHGAEEEVASTDRESGNRQGAVKPAGRGRFAWTPPGRGLGLRRGQGRLVPEIIPLSDEEKKTLEIQTVKVSRRAMRSQLKAMGKVLSPQQKRAIVNYAFPARIADIHVALGDWVKVGAKLVTLQSEEVGKARAEFFKAEADFELAKRNLEREKNLNERGVGARKNLLATEAEFKVAEASLDAAEKKLHVLGFSEDQVEEMKKTHQVNPVISLYAPIGGKIIAFSAVRGAMVDQNTEILSIMDPTVVWVDAEIYERDIARIKLGQEVKVSVPAYPAESFQGKVSFIGDVLKEESRTITVRTEVPNRDYRLKPGMFADMTVYLNHQDEVLAVPEEAVLDDRDDKIVFVRVNEGYRLQVVKVGMKDAGFWEISSGLAEEEEVVTTGSYQLKSKLYDEILKSAGVH
jgi:cobalt-zinc-cadmium efflux system membrane fusion protein